MRDLYDAQAWADNHDQFSLWAATALGRLGSALRRAVPAQLVAAAFAVGLAVVTLGGSAA